MLAAPRIFFALHAAPVPHDACKKNAPRRFRRGRWERGRPCGGFYKKLYQAQFES